MPVDFLDGGALEGFEIGRGGQFRGEDSGDEEGAAMRFMAGGE